MPVQNEGTATTGDAGRSLAGSAVAFRQASGSAPAGPVDGPYSGVAAASERLSPLVRCVIDHFQTSYLDPRSLVDLAKILHKSPFQIIRRFRRETQTTPHAYLIRLRVAHAAHLLGDGVSIAQVAAATGFSDQSHLTRHFKRWTGMTPGTFQRRRIAAFAA